MEQGDTVVDPEIFRAEGRRGFLQAIHILNRNERDSHSPGVGRYVSSWLLRHRRVWRRTEAKHYNIPDSFYERSRSGSVRSGDPQSPTDTQFPNQKPDEWVDHWPQQVVGDLRVIAHCQRYSKGYFVVFRREAITVRSNYRGRRSVGRLPLLPIRQVQARYRNIT